MDESILIVEDEPDLVATLEYNLQNEGYRTSAALNGESALRAIVAESPPDLVILDLMLPDISGLDVCRRLKQAEGTRDVPVLMLTAKGEEIDRVVGFEVGADDYVVKPFSVRELMLRIRALLRRSRGPIEEHVQLVHGNIKLDITAHEVWIEDREVTLTALEFKLLHTFLKRRGRVQTREALLEDVWGMCPDVETRTVDTHVKRLRHKLGDAGVLIETVRGVGYRFSKDVREERS